MTDDTNTDENVEETPAEETPPAEAEAAAEAEAPAEEAAPDIDPSLPRKERLRLLKSRESGAAGPQRSPDERQAERVALRKQKAAARSRRRKQEREKAR